MAEEKGKSKDAKASDAWGGAQEKMSGVEEKLNQQSQKLPQLSKDTKSGLMKAFPWVTGFVALLSLNWAQDLWEAIDALDDLGAFGSFVSSALPSSGELWIVLIFYLVFVGFVGFSFYKGLLKATKQSWDFLFYGYLALTVAGLLFLVLLSELDSSRDIVSIALGLGGLYALFQLRPSFKK